jgi:carboxyl-terminal processing protease
LDKRRLRPWLCGMALFLGVCCGGGTLHAGPADDQPLLKKALELEGKGQYRAACPLWETLASRDAAHREGYQRCLRHVLQDRRHREDTFRDAILGLKRSGHVLDVYVRVLLILQSHYVERDKTEASRLFHQGVLELRYALDDETFRKTYLAKASPGALADFRKGLAEWEDKLPQDNEEARDHLRSVARAANEALSLALPVVAFEFICGACNSLDEYTAYLTPAQTSEMQAMIRGRFAGTGIELAVVDNKLVIARIHPDSPAAKTFKVGDRLTRIDRQPIDPSLPGEARARMRGEPGSEVEIEVLPSNEMATRSLKFERQPYVLPSVEYKREPREGVGYVRVLSFTETTVQELRDAVLHLQTAGMKALVLDLRGNPGGLFKPSVEVAEMFLPDGLIVHMQSRLKDLNGVHKSNNPNALTLPLVLIIDGATASSAELLAGALKENERATLVGQSTFGKGSIQLVVPLQIVSAGVRITVARFLSPSGQPYTGRGVTPHVVVAVVGDPDQDNEIVLATAWREARQRMMMEPRED